MTPAEIQQAQMRAAALRGQEFQPEPIDTRQADALSGIGGALAGLGGHSVRAMSQDMTGRGDALRALSVRGQRPKTPEELDAMAARAEYERAKGKALGAPKPVKDTSFGDATDLRKELSGLPETKAIVEAEASYHQLANASNDATGDVARIYALAKTFDPGGRVTDSDYAAAKQGQGPMARFQGAINELEGRGMLSDQTRRNMEATARGLLEKRRKDYEIITQKFKGLAEKRKLDPGDVVIREAPAAAKPGGLTPEQKKRRDELRAKYPNAVAK